MTSVLVAITPRSGPRKNPVETAETKLSKKLSRVALKYLSLEDTAENLEVANRLDPYRLHQHLRYTNLVVRPFAVFSRHKASVKCFLDNNFRTLVLAIKFGFLINIQWCSKEIQNDTIYEVNYLFLTWCFTIQKCYHALALLAPLYN